MNRIRFSITCLLGCSTLAAIATMCVAITCLSSTTFAADLPDVLPYGIETIPATPTVRAKGERRTIDLIGRSVADAYVPRRVQAQTELGSSQSPAAARYVRTGLGDADPQVRAVAAWAAGQIGEPTLAADLKPLLRDADARVRREAVLSGAALGDSSFIDAGLADADDSVVAAAVSVATAAHADKIAAAMEKYLPGIQLIALRSLGRIGNGDQSHAIIKFLTGPDVALRSASVETIGRMKLGGVSGYVLKLVDDPHPTVRRSALTAMSLMAKPTLALSDAVPSTEEFQKRCITALGDPDLSVRENAASLLVKQPTPTAIEALLANLPSESSRLHAAARDALVAIGEPTVPVAEKLLTDPAARRREDGSYLLGRLKSDASLAAHIKLTEDTDWGVVRQAVESLGLIGRKEAIPAVSAITHRAFTTKLDAPYDPAINAAVEQAILASTSLGDASILAPCRTILPQDKNFPVNYRTAAAYAIGRLGDPADRTLGGALNRPMNNDEESFSVKFECLKAMGHLKLPAAAPWVGKDRASSTFTGDAYADWLTHWIRSRLSGQVDPLEPFPEPWQLQMSIRPLQN